MRQNARGVLIAAGCALVALGGLAPRPGAPAAAAEVTAHPPLEAVPATSGARAQQSRLRRCAAAARSKHLTGAARESYVRSCAAARHPPAPKPAH